MSEAREENPLMGQRRFLRDAITESFQKYDTGFADHVIVGFALVVELAGPDGSRGIAGRSSDATGDTDLTPWAATGLLRWGWSANLFEASMNDVSLDHDEEEDDD